MQKLLPVMLQGSWIQLEPINEAHKNELYLAAQDAAIWTHVKSVLWSRLEK